VSADQSPEQRPVSQTQRWSVRRWGALAVSVVALGAVLFGMPLVLRAYVIEAFQIPSGAMIPTLLVGDHIFCSKRTWDVGRGDVIVFRYPPDPTVDYIKRVVGLPGDQIQISGEGLLINGRPVPRRAIGTDCPEDMTEGAGCQEWEETLDNHEFRVLQQAELPQAFGPVIVPPGHVFVMGDNRDNSYDSRVWGAVPLANIKAHAMSIWWSRGPAGVRWDRIGRAVR
jgi:signal peptidase I